jgi:hypothetical protein
MILKNSFIISIRINSTTYIIFTYFYGVLGGLGFFSSFFIFLFFIFFVFIFCFISAIYHHYGYLLAHSPYYWTHTPIICYFHPTTPPPPILTLFLFFFIFFAHFFYSFLTSQKNLPTPATSASSTTISTYQA